MTEADALAEVADEWGVWGGAYARVEVRAPVDRVAEQRQSGSSTANVSLILSWTVFLKLSNLHIKSKKRLQP